MKYMFPFGLVLVIALSSCTGKSKEEKECMVYFDSIKQKLAERELTITSLLDKAADEPEIEKPELMSPAIIEKLADDLANKSNGTRVPGIGPANVFIVSTEEYKQKEGYQSVVENDFNLPVYKKGLANMIISKGEEIRKGKGTCYLGSSINYFQQDTDDYLKAKYLVVTDCVFYKPAGWDTGQRLVPGLIVKNVKVINTETGKTEADFYLKAVSSEKVSVKNNDMSAVSQNLRDNFTGALTASLFSGGQPTEFNHFTSY